MSKRSPMQLSHLQSTAAFLVCSVWWRWTNVKLVHSTVLRPRIFWRHSARNIRRDIVPTITLPRPRGKALAGKERINRDATCHKLASTMSQNRPTEWDTQPLASRKRSVNVHNLTAEVDECAHACTG